MTEMRHQRKLAERAVKVSSAPTAAEITTCNVCSKETSAARLDGQERALAPEIANV
jgi:hypothetical protein